MQILRKEAYLQYIAVMKNTALGKSWTFDEAVNFNIFFFVAVQFNWHGY